MTKKSRTVIFIICIILFALAAPSAIFYSQGYRLDFEGKKIVQTGAFYFQVTPGRAEVYVNGKIQKNTSLLTDSAYIENLLPKKYLVEIKKNGFHSWQKTLEIREKEVTKAENVVLFPENPRFTQTQKTYPKIINSATSSDKKKVTESDGHEISIRLIEEDEKIFLTRFSEKIGNIFWLNDYYLIFSAGNKIKIAEIDDRDRLNIIDLAEFSAQGGSASGGENLEIIWDENAEKLYVISGEETYLLDNLLP